MKVAGFIAATLMATPSLATLGGALLCTGANQTGICSRVVASVPDGDNIEGDCVQLQPPFYRNTSTFLPDGEAFACYPRSTDCDGICRSPTGCTPGAISFASENKLDLGEFSQSISSFGCFRNSTDSSGSQAGECDGDVPEVPEIPAVDEEATSTAKRGSTARAGKASMVMRAIERRALKRGKKQDKLRRTTSTRAWRDGLWTDERDGD